MKIKLKKLRRRIRTFLSDKPEVYIPLARILKGDFIVNKKTEIVIEGYPRSGNSFAEAAFRFSQTRP
jgi:hypothetical protein